ncbi:MAG: hypothetical protein HRF50_02070 [Phycisphaerae bacterium]|jgi:hypothetical protein
MNLRTLASAVDAPTARAFVSAARHVIDALLIEAARVQQAQSPAPRDYENAGLPRTTPAGAWIAHDELRETARRMGEAIAAEKWTDGVLFAIRVFTQLGML